MQTDEPAVPADERDSAHASDPVAEIDLVPHVVQQGDGLAVDAPLPPITYRAGRSASAFVVKFGDYTLSELLSEVAHGLDHGGSDQDSKLTHSPTPET